MIYFYDGTKEAFFTAFLRAFDDADAVLASAQKQLSIGQETVFVRADPARAARVEKRFLELDRDCIRELELMLRSGDTNRDNIAFCYFRKIAKLQQPVRRMLSSGAVLDANECINRVTYEIHRFHGFLRFMESASGALYGPFSPDNDICDLLAPHFRARLQKYPFVIHDVKRKKACVFDGENTFVAPLTAAEVVLSADEDAWRKLWRTYYKSVNIPSRERLKQMRGYMPVRYWKHLTEFT